jgi:hypothetical protein
MRYRALTHQNCSIIDRQHFTMHFSLTPCTYHVDVCPDWREQRAWPQPYGKNTWQSSLRRTDDPPAYVHMAVITGYQYQEPCEHKGRGRRSPGRCCLHWYGCWKLKDLIVFFGLKFVL